MTRLGCILCHLLCLCVLPSVHGGAAPPPVIGLPPPPPIPPPPLAQNKPTQEPDISVNDTMETPSTNTTETDASNITSVSINASADSGNISNDSLGTQEGSTGGEAFANATKSNQTFDVFTVETEASPNATIDVAVDPQSKIPPTIEASLPPAMPDASEHIQGHDSIVQPNDTVDSTATNITQAPATDHVVTTVNVTANETEILNRTGDIATTTPDKATDSHIPDSNGTLPSQDVKGIKVDLPLPPPVFGEKPSMVFKKETGATTIEIKSPSFDKLIDLTTESNFTTSGGTLPSTTTAMVSGSTVTDQMVTTEPGIRATAATLATSTEPTISDTSVKDIPKRIEPAVPDITQALDGRVPDLPPPIFVPESSAVIGEGKGGQTISKTTDKPQPSKKTAQPPPPPIFFQDFKHIPTSWVDLRLTTTTKKPVPPERKQIKPIPPELDPKFMSVSELAFYTLQQMEKDRRRKDSIGKGMGVQVFFNTLQPFEFKQATPLPEGKPNRNEATPANQTFDRTQLPPTDKQADSASSLVQTTVSPAEPANPLEPPPFSKKFYSADDLLSQIGAVLPQKPQPATTVPNNVPRRLFKPFLPVINDVRPEKQSPKTEKPAQSRPFYDSNFLLKQLGLLTAPTPSVTTLPPTRQQTRPKPLIKPFVLNTNFAGQPTQNTWPQTIKPTSLGQRQSGENQLMKFQRRGQVHTRPIDLRTNTNTQPFIDYNVNPRHPKTPNDQGVGGNKLKDSSHIRGNLVTERIPFTDQVTFRPNVANGQQSRAVRYIFGSTPIEKHTSLWQNTRNTGNNVAMRLRANFNKRLEQSHEPEELVDWPKATVRPPLPDANNVKRDIQITSNAFDTINPSVDSIFNFNTNFRGFDTSRFGVPQTPVLKPRTRLPNQSGFMSPRTGSEVRRDFNRHIKDEFTETTVKPFSSWNQPSFLNTGNQPQFPLASQRGVESQISPLRTSALITDFFKPSNYKTNIKTIDEVAKVKPGYHTHWSAPQSNSLANKVVNVPYRFEQIPVSVKQGTTESPMVYRLLTTTQSPMIYRLLTTTQSPMIYRLLTTTQSPIVTTDKTTTTTKATTTTTQSTTSTTYVPTVPPTANPNPPPIFDTKVVKTFMPIPKAEDMAKSTVSGGQLGWGDNKTDSNVDGRCSKCVFVNDRCLLPDPKHCNVYIECVKQGRQVRAFVRSCALGAFFDRKSFLCVDPKIADCPTDRCRVSGVKWYPIEGHCKHYWSCGIREGGSAFAQSECCPDMGGFKDGEGCVENPNCTESCESAVNTNAPTGCKLRKTSSPTLYYDENAKLERPCAPGTLFNELQCTCVQDVVFERSENRTDRTGGGNCNCTNDTTCACRGAAQAPTGETYCAPSLALTFDGKKITDSSNTNQHIGVEGVSQTNTGEAIFNGGGKLVLWRYANLMIPIVFAVRLRFLPTSTEPRYQTLMSNCDKNGAIESTFELAIDTLYSEVIFNINTYDGPAKRFKIMYEPSAWSSVDLIYDGERIVGSVNGRSRNIISGGGIETRPFPLAVGGCPIKKGYKGLMDNVYIYEQCIPDDMYGIFMSVLE